MNHIHSHIKIFKKNKKRLNTIHGSMEHSICCVVVEKVNVGKKKTKYKFPSGGSCSVTTLPTNIAISVTNDIKYLLRYTHKVNLKAVWVIIRHLVSLVAELNF